MNKLFSTKAKIIFLILSVLLIIPSGGASLGIFFWYIVFAYFRQKRQIKKGIACYRGIDVPKNEKRAYEILSSLGEEVKDPEVYVCLGEMSEYGHGTEMNKEKALKYYKAAYRSGRKDLEQKINDILHTHSEIEDEMNSENKCSNPGAVGKTDVPDKALYKNVNNGSKEELEDESFQVVSKTPESNPPENVFDQNEDHSEDVDKTKINSSCQIEEQDELADKKTVEKLEDLLSEKMHNIMEEGTFDDLLNLAKEGCLDAMFEISKVYATGHFRNEQVSVNRVRCYYYGALAAQYGHSEAISCIADVLRVDWFPFSDRETKSYITSLTILPLSYSKKYTEIDKNTETEAESFLDQQSKLYDKLYKPLIQILMKNDFCYIQANTLLDDENVGFDDKWRNVMTFLCTSIDLYQNHQAIFKMLNVLSKKCLSAGKARNISVLSARCGLSCVYAHIKDHTEELKALEIIKSFFSSMTEFDEFMAAEGAVLQKKAKALAIFTRDIFTIWLLEKDMSHEEFINLVNNQKDLFDYNAIAKSNNLENPQGNQPPERRNEQQVEPKETVGIKESDPVKNPDPQKGKSDSNLNPYTGLDAKDALKALGKDILNGVVTAVKDSVNDAKNAVTDVQKEKGTAAAALFVGKKVGKFLGQAALYTLESQIEKQAEKEGRLDEWREKKQQAADAYESIQYQAKSEPSDDDGLN